MCPSHVDTRFTCDFVTPEPFELHISVRGQKGLEFHQKSNGHVPSHVKRVLHVSTRDVNVILKILNPLSYTQILGVKMG